MGEGEFRFDLKFGGQAKVDAIEKVTCKQF